MMKQPKYPMGRISWSTWRPSGVTRFQSNPPTAAKTDSVEKIMAA
jgi:hypothetical protein